MSKHNIYNRKQSIDSTDICNDSSVLCEAHLPKFLNEVIDILLHSKGTHTLLDAFIDQQKRGHENSLIVAIKRDNKLPAQHVKSINLLPDNELLGALIIMLDTLSQPLIDANAELGRYMLDEQSLLGKFKLFV